MTSKQLDVNDSAYEEAMQESVDKLKNLLDTQQSSNVIDNDARKETQQLVENISNTINKMMMSTDIDGIPGGNDLSTADSQLGLNANDEFNSTTSSINQHNNMTVTTLPPFPTPYELWRKAHEIVDQKPKQKELTESQWETLVHRLNDSGRKKHVAIMRAQHKVIADELSSLSFKPKINPKSKKISQIAPLQERLSHIMRAKEEKLEVQRQLQKEKEEETMTGTPKINTTKKWIPRVRNNYTTTIDGSRDKEEEELTFSPEINSKSRKICEKLSNNRRIANRHLITVKGTSEDVGHHEETFSPEINFRSKVLANSEKYGTNACFRLYEMAMQKNGIKRKQKPNNVSSNNKSSSNEQVNSPIGSPKSANNISITYEASVNSTNQDPRYGGVNVIEFKPEFQFVLDKFVTVNQ